MSLQNALVRARYRWLPDHVVGELLAKTWMDNAIPFASLLAAVVVFGSIVPHFFEAQTLSDLARQFAELGLVVLGLSVVMISGGIDLSVGSMFALSVLTTLIGVNAQGWSVGAALAATLGVALLCGALNGVLVGYFRLRAFLTTLVTLIIFRSVFDLVFPLFSTAIVTGQADSAVWDYLALGTLAGVPASFLVTAAICVVAHVVLSRMRYGWRLMAVGGARRSAHNAGVDVRRTIFVAYLCSGLLCGVSGFLFAARIGSGGSDIGSGLELLALTATVLGGNSLGGGRGSVPKAAMGTVFVLILSNSLFTLAVPGPVSNLALGVILIAAVFLDVRWLKNRHKILNKVYVSPAYFTMKPAQSTEAGSPLAPNDKLRDVGVIGLGILEGAEDVIFDRDDNLYTGNRHGEIMRWFPPDYTRYEVLAHIGGSPLGLQFDRDGKLTVCVAGMGLYQVGLDGEVRRLTAETNRSLFSIVDDSNMRLADDLDIAPDGRIFFSEATTRFEMHDWFTDALESRGNGRIICYDPKTGRTRTVLRNLIFPNGICTAHDNVSILFAESWACRISRYYFAGPKTGRVEVVIDDLPGYPDNINRASDGHYWLALMGARTPALDLSLQMPGFRRRMARRCSSDVWMMPNLNTGCVVKFSDEGTIIESLWDLGGRNHPMITSMQEHKGVLYLCGIFNNRMGTYPLPQADQAWTSVASYWGAPA